MSDGDGPPWDDEIPLSPEDLARAAGGEPIIVRTSWAALSPYRSAVARVAGNDLGRPIVRVVCSRCGEQRKGRTEETTIGTVSDTAHRTVTDAHPSEDPAAAVSDTELTAHGVSPRSGGGRRC